MDERGGPDPTRALWERWRRPVLVVVALVFILNQWDRFASGRPFLIVTGAGVAAFWISVLFSRSAPEPARRTDAHAWRAVARRRLILFGSWSAVAAVWLAVAIVVYGVRPVAAVVLLAPSLLMVSAWWAHRQADRIAASERGAVAA